VAEAYPELKTNETFQHLQARISGLENAIADRREFYNESVNVNDVRIEQFPDLLVALRQQYLDLLTSGVNLLLIAIGWQLESRAGWLLAFALVAATSLVTWMGNVRRHRMIADTPTSKIASAPQGYVEFFGTAAQFPGDQLASRINGRPCVWLRFHVERRTDESQWESVDRGVSHTSFLLDDGSGQCVIDPDHAEIVGAHKLVKEWGGYRHTEYLLLPRDPLYAIGQHTTLGGANTDLNLRQDINDLLAEWKRDQPTLLKRFDLDGDGRIELREWELARRQAQREVEKQHREIRLQDGVHVLRKPQDGRLFLISNQSPPRLARKYLIWGWVHLTLVLVAAAGAGYNFVAV
jgi:hypothetical protein